MLNLTRVALAAVAALVAYMAVGGVYFAVPGLRAEFAKYPAVFRSGEAMNSVMAIGMSGIFLAIVVAAVIFARIHPTGAGLAAGAKFGLLLALFQLGSFVLHNHMNLNIGWRLTALQAAVFSSEWLAVGVVISLVYRG
jgi:hypothetical protein